MFNCQVIDGEFHPIDPGLPIGFDDRDFEEGDPNHYDDDY